MDITMSIESTQQESSLDFIKVDALANCFEWIQHIQEKIHDIL